MVRIAALLVPLLLLVACDVVSWQRGRHERTLRAAGLRPAQVVLGADSVHYWAGGSGPPMVLVHGFGADGVWGWHPQVQDLARTRRLIIPDLLWFGGSRSTQRDYAIAHQARMLAALARHLRASRATWVGISYGGLVVHELARLHPELVQRLVIVDSPGRGFTEDDYRALCRRFSVDHIARLLIPEDAAGVRRLAALAYHEPPWMPDFAARQALPMLGSCRTEKLALIEALLAELRRPQRGTPRAPTLIIWGRDDPVFPLYLGRRLQRQIPGAQLEVIERARHAPNLEQPAVFNRLLARFADAPAAVQQTIRTRKGAQP